MNQVIFNSYKEAIRDRVISMAIVFGIIMIFSSAIIGPLSLGEEIRIAKDLGLFSISFFGILIILFIGNRTIYREVKEKTIYLILTRPITRFKFIFGKALGLFLTVFVASMVLGVILFAYITLLTGHLSLNIILAVLGVIFQLFILSSFMILVSTFLNPFLGSVFTIFIYILGQIIPRAIPLALYYEQNMVAKVLHVIHHIFPDLTYLDFREMFIYGSTVPIERIVFSFAYAISYILILVLIAGLIFERKDL